jgi:hypothetical protein
MAFHVNEDDQTVLEAESPQNAYYDLIVPAWMAGDEDAMDQLSDAERARLSADERKEGQLCVLRVRYNVSTADFPGAAYLSDDGEFLCRCSCLFRS